MNTASQQATPVAAAPVAANNAVAAPAVDQNTAGHMGLPAKGQLQIIAVPPLFERVCTGIQTGVITLVGGIVVYDRFIGGK